MKKLNYSNSLIKATAIGATALSILFMQGITVNPVTAKNPTTPVEIETNAEIEEITTIMVNKSSVEKESKLDVSIKADEKPIVAETKPVKEYKYYKVVDTLENNWETTLDLELQDYLYETCKKYGVEEHYELLMAQMYNESRFQTDIISKTHDWGIMQINECNHEWLSETLGITNFLDPYQSIECGVYMMSGYLKKYPAETALVAYNAGESKVRNGVTSTKYSKRVLGYVPMLTEIPEGN